MKIACVCAAAGAWLATASLASAVTVTDFAIYAQDDVRIRGTVTGDVGSHTDDVRVKKKTSVSGDVSAWDNVRIGRHSSVDGDVNAGGLIRRKRTSTVEGALRPGLTDTDLASVLASDLLPPHDFTAGGDSYNVKNHSLTLAPGSYGSVAQKGPADLYLKSGDYYFADLSGRQTHLMLDLSQGGVDLFVEGPMRLKKTSVFVKDAGGDYVPFDQADPDLAGLVYAEVHGRAKLKRSDWFGTIYTPYDLLTARKVCVIGALYGGEDIRLRGELSFVQYAPPGGDSPPDDGGDPAGDGGDGGNGDEPTGGPIAAVPEPTTLALLCSGLLALAAGRRKWRVGRST